MLTLTNAILAADKQPVISLNAGAAWAKGFGLLCIMVILVYLTGKGLVKHASRGDTSSSFSMAGATLICLFPLGLIGGAAVLTGYGSALLSVVTKILGPTG